MSTLRRREVAPVNLSACRKNLDSLRLLLENSNKIKKGFSNLAPDRPRSRPDPDLSPVKSQQASVRTAASEKHNSEYAVFGSSNRESHKLFYMCPLLGKFAGLCWGILWSPEEWGSIEKAEFCEGK